ncbi:tripartite tricarboxylate transporter TctB family protein [Uruburuella testudinis]|uniref:Tripartite tricarboxylate transporter TctB family protein n=1 Tax=Uruburuella testudinis TaxID=1282863 RepID=A0ABY4DRM0_9NEIS|nr:tripartite tricarboxylate transporter TctB family protein [Uruburuella testudinis]UOO81678.1 tripartite tricarboxylate transporter TctB family protein [Uruburuella testudinis]
MNIERWFSGLLALAAIGLLTLAWGYTAPIAYDPIGPRPYPMLVLSLLALACIYLVLRPSTLTGALNLGYTPAILKNIGLCILCLLAYALLFELIGFPAATALMAFCIGKLFGGSTRACIISGICLGALLYTLFDVLLDVPLPLGFFG